MKRSEIETKVTDVKTDLRSRIESAPVPAFLCGLVLGMIVAVFGRVLVPLVFIVAVVLLVLWLIADQDKPEEVEVVEAEQKEEKEKEGE